MGANRLASNSLIECLVFGKRAVEDSIMNKRVHPFPVVTSHFKLLPEKQNAYLELKNKIADIMTRNAGIIRTESGLRQGLDDLDEWLSAPNFRKERILFDSE